MATYVTLADCVDAAIKVDDRHLDGADVFIGLSLKAIGLSDADIADITLPNATLTNIASAQAKYLACVEKAVGEDSPLAGKAKLYKEMAQSLVKMLNRAALGLETPTGSGFGFFDLGRA